MQPRWSGTYQKARDRVVGTVLGALAVAVVIWVVPLPSPVLIGIGVLALVLGFACMQSRPVLGNAGTMFTTVALNTTTGHPDAATALLWFGGLIGAAVVIGLLLGFAVVPGVRRPRPAELLRTAVTAERALMDAVTTAVRAADADRPELVRRFREASTARGNLVAPVPGTSPSDDERAVADRAARALGGLTTTMTALLADREIGLALAPAVTETASWLGADDPGPDPRTGPSIVDAAGIDDEQRLLLEGMAADALTVRDAAAHWSPELPTR